MMSLRYRFYSTMLVKDRRDMRHGTLEGISSGNLMRKKSNTSSSRNTLSSCLENRSDSKSCQYGTFSALHGRLGVEESYGKCSFEGI